MITFGPIPSRRLGKSLGINNIPAPKRCTYACIYCQVGSTQEHIILRQDFYDPSEIFEGVKLHLQKLGKEDQPDYLTFVPNGEPALDKGLGKSIKLLKSLNIPVAVITNASLLFDNDVVEALCESDWVSLKCDSAVKSVWRAINRPHKGLNWDRHIHCLRDFASHYNGRLVTETMLVKGVNDDAETLSQTASLISNLNPSLAYISIPIRPPAKDTVKASDEAAINMAYQIFSDNGLEVELTLGFEGTDTGFTGNAEDDIMNISAVHPLREDTMKELLRKNGADRSTVDKLVCENKIKVLTFNGKRFYLRNISS